MRRVLLEHRWASVAEEDVTFPNGHVAPWLFIEGPGDGSQAIAIDSSNRILVQEQWCPPIADYVVQFPGGLVPDGASHQDTIRRELVEESGVAAQNFRFIGKFLINNRRSRREIHSFVATDISTEPTAPEPEELITTAWMTHDEIDELIRGGTKHFSYSFLAGWSLYRASQKA